MDDSFGTEPEVILTANIENILEQYRLLSIEEKVICCRVIINEKIF